MVHYVDMAADLLSNKNLLFSENYSDLTFVIDGKNIPAHQMIVLEKCEYFRRLVSFEETKNPTKYGKRKEIELTEMAEEDLRYFLMKVYT